MLDGHRRAPRSTGTNARSGAGISLFVPAGTSWTASGDARAVSVLVHEPEPSTRHAVVDCDEVEKGTATAGRQFVLGATPDAAASATQFIGLIPPGRAPDHFHRYDEVIYVLEGEGYLDIGGEQAPIRARHVHPPAADARPLPREHRRDARCACSACSARPARPPRPTTPTARWPSSHRRGD